MPHNIIRLLYILYSRSIHTRIFFEISAHDELHHSFFNSFAYFLQKGKNLSLYKTPQKNRVSKKNIKKKSKIFTNGHIIPRNIININ